MITENANIAEANPTMQHAQPNLSFLEGKNLFIYNVLIMKKRKLFRLLFLSRGNPIVKSLRKFQGATTHVLGLINANCIL